MTTLRGATAAITGAGGGIGAALALKLAARGADVALADRNEAGLRAVAAAIGNERKVGNDARLVDLLQRLRPSSYWPVVELLERVAKKR
jgi:NAD(P)-dependent dehydrogenase (short-subunit alcohol dehydrogenase family)